MSLEIEHVSKKYRSVFHPERKTRALEDVSFDAGEGSIVAMIGQNGAGKTTMIKCILGLLHPDGGRITMEGESVASLIKKGELGYMPEALRFPAMTTLEDYLSDLLVLRGRSLDDYRDNYDGLCDRLYLKTHLKKLLTQYSKGNMKKAAFMQAVVHKPRLLILDEPTDGLDPVSRRALLNELLSIKQAGGTVVITSHLLSDLLMVADKAVVLQNGRLIRQTRIKDIDTSLDDWYLEVVKESGGMVTL